jgi:hypothetical protein
MSKDSEFSKLDATVRKVLSVSHDELVRREKEWKRKRKLKAKPPKATATPTEPKPRRATKSKPASR